MTAPPPSEAEVTAAIRQYLNLIGAWSLKILGGLGQRPGVPDLLVCHRGRFIAIEVKKPAARGRRGGKLQPRQVLELEGIRDAGGLVVVATSVDDVIDAIEIDLPEKGD